MNILELIEILCNYTSISGPDRFDNGQYNWKYDGSPSNFVNEKYLILKKSSKDNKIYGCVCIAKVISGFNGDKIVFSS